LKNVAYFGVVRKLESNDLNQMDQLSNLTNNSYISSQIFIFLNRILFLKLF